MQFSTYLFFDGRCEEAAAFYKQAIGAEVVFMMRYGESPDPHPPGMVPPGFDDKVMHMTLKVGEQSMMAADDCSDHAGTGHPRFTGFALSLVAQTDAEAETLFAALGEGGSVTMSLAKTFFASKYGMLTDRFGMHWMVMVGDEA